MNFRCPCALLVSMSIPLIEIDGSLGEGGGQILRSSLALALVSGKPFRLFNIRASRPKPGLQAQHLTCVRAAATVGQATVRGASLGSRDLTFEPGEVLGGRYHFAIGTAGATSLVVHTLYLPLALSAAGPSEITITGGTHVTHSPSFHFLETTWRGYLQLYALRIGLKMRRPGFYPRGGGILEARIQPCKRLQAIIQEKLEPAKKATVLSAVAGLPEDIAKRQARRAVYRLCEAGIAAEAVQESWEGGPGTVLAVRLQTHPVPTVFCALGQRGKPGSASPMKPWMKSNVTSEPNRPALTVTAPINWFCPWPWPRALQLFKWPRLLSTF
jgi:RNA 3'-phosphate cyclase